MTTMTTTLLTPETAERNVRENRRIAKIVKEVEKAQQAVFDHQDRQDRESPELDPNEPAPLTDGERHVTVSRAREIGHRGRLPYSKRMHAAWYAITEAYDGKEIDRNTYLKCLIALNEIALLDELAKTGRPCLTEAQAKHILDALVDQRTPQFPTGMVQFYRRMRYRGF